MGKEINILFDIIDIWAKQNELYSVQCSVISVNQNERTCEVSPIDESPNIIDVRLEADYTDGSSTNPKGFFVVPSVGSLVVVSFLNKTDAFISAWTSIDNVIMKQGQFTFNDGSNGGLIKVNEQETKLNDLVSEIQDELIKIQTAITGVGGTYVPGTITDFNGEDYENDKIKH